MNLVVFGALRGRDGRARGGERLGEVPLTKNGTRIRGRLVRADALGRHALGDKIAAPVARLEGLDRLQDAGLPRAALGGAEGCDGWIAAGGNKS